MARGLSIRSKFESIRTLAHGSIGAAYSAIGTPFQHPIRQFILTNLTDAALYFSLDGVNDHLVLPQSGYFVSDIASNKTQNTGLYLAKGDKFYVKEIGSPSSGAVYLSVMYGE